MKNKKLDDQSNLVKFVEFQYEIEQIISSALFTFTNSKIETTLLQRFIAERDETRRLLAIDDSSGVLDSIIKAQAHALEIFKCIKGGEISFSGLRDYPL
jgi:hypothetical protein